MAEKFAVNWNAIQHHVAILQRAGRIHVDDRGWNHELFSPDVPAQHRRLVSALHHPDRALILDAVLAHPGIRSGEIVQCSGFSHRRVLGHLANLRHDQLIQRIGSTPARYVAAELPLGLDLLWESLGYGFEEPADAERSSSDGPCIDVKPVASQSPSPKRYAQPLPPLTDIRAKSL